MTERWWGGGGRKCTIANFIFQFSFAFILYEKNYSEINKTQASRMNIRRTRKIIPQSTIWHKLIDQHLQAKQYSHKKGDI